LKNFFPDLWQPWKHESQLAIAKNNSQLSVLGQKKNLKLNQCARASLSCGIFEPLLSPKPEGHLIIMMTTMIMITIVIIIIIMIVIVMVMVIMIMIMIMIMIIIIIIIIIKGTVIIYTYISILHCIFYQFSIFTIGSITVKGKTSKIP